MNEHEPKPPIFNTDQGLDWESDLEMTAWALEFLKAFMAQQDLEFFLRPSFRQQMMGEDIPEILDLISGARP